MTGMKRHDLDSIWQINENEAPVDHRESLNEVETRLSIYGSRTVGTPEIQKALESGDATDARGDALDVLTMDDFANEQAPEHEDNASDKDGDECAAAESEEEIVDKTFPPSWR